ncbi:hypothetical protein BKA57DRAFT_457907 [Linnemannia elongata]|nr:hypothetical protein BKA57DRAFT_457907 [Linnemannia elongata]
MHLVTILINTIFIPILFFPLCPAGSLIRSFTESAAMKSIEKITTKSVCVTNTNEEIIRPLGYSSHCTLRAPLTE